MVFAMSDNTLSSRLFKQLTDAIVCGELAPGQKLSEKQLSERFAAGRVPVREAIQRLEQSQLVVRVPHAGARVIDLSLAQLKDIYEVRMELECMACRLAAERMSPDERRQLQQLLDTHQQHISDDAGQSYYPQNGDLDFHYLIIQGSHNQRLQHTLCNDLYQLVRMYRFRTSSVHKRPARALQEHQRIAEAVISGDAELAQLLMRRHIQTSLTNLEQLIEQQSQSEQ